MDAPKKDYVPNLTIMSAWGMVMIGIIVAIIVLLALGLPQDWRTEDGLLDTGAPLMADLTVLAFVLLLVPGMIVGFVFARQKRFVPYHQATMTTILLLNWGLIAFIMAANFEGVSDYDKTSGIVRPHALFGLIAQVIGTVLVIRMWFEESLPQSLRFGNIKLFMRITLACWLIAAVLGITTYVRLYEPFSDDGDSGAPVSTPEPTEPAADETDEPEMEETDEPALEETDEPDMEDTPEMEETDEADMEETPETEETLEMEETEEADDS